MFKSLFIVFKDKRYLMIAIILFFLITGAIIWFQNRELINGVFGSFDFISSLKILLLSFGSIISNNTIFSAVGLTLTAFLFSINITLFVYYIRRKISLEKKAGAFKGIFGFVLGLLGVGCASCGSIVLSSVLSLFGLGGLLTFLPLGGGEFLIVGIIFLLFSIYGILKRISSNTVCSI